MQPMNLVPALQSTFSFDHFRPGQEQTIQQLLSGFSSLAIFPTGSGKSLCYQFTATQLPHLTLVVSPLLALMKDQLAFLQNKGIAAASIDSSLSAEENQQVMADVRSGKIKILMISVERFKNERFRQFIGSVAISMLVVDEAHCISEWGHNFRPDYLKLPQYKAELNIPLVLLLTATATKKVKRDMSNKFAIAPEHVVQTGFYRPNLDLTVLPITDQQRNQTLLNIIQQQQGTGIVYVTLQNTAETVAEFLQRAGLNAVAYHAGFDSEQRKQIQHQFMAGQYDVVVATIAFGMGIDKSDIRYVIHYDLPKSIENYSQEIGRAGRDGQHANCFVLANLDGINTVENFVYGDTPELNGIQAVIDNIRTESQNGQWETQIIPLSNASNIRQLALKTLLVQLEVMKAIKPVYSYFAEFKIKLIESKDAILGRFNEDRQLFLNQIFEHTQFKKIWGTLNFDSLYHAYGSDRNRVIAALEYLDEQGLIQLETKGMTEVYEVNMEVIHQTNLASDLTHYFAEKETSEIQRIAAMVRFFELDSCLSWNLARYFDDQAAPQHCGHCSVCRGQIAKLQFSQAAVWPEDQFLIQNIHAMTTDLMDKKGLAAKDISPALITRFLTGISVPVFARTQLRKMSGWASCEHLRYREVLEKVDKLMEYGDSNVT
ncbi:RecQ family ATP-dependent DNA helicase [Litoribrevibacter albus]|uniref:ATP-dependent DNA helicase RecQ n=1 Tax=Litoribrevibacter albus TaxID=1473156 RepID=A0AA37SAF2_9GAMM|nr:ATP-dependent DNA helicase RecQ [Litoribrevibacter albus]